MATKRKVSKPVRPPRATVIGFRVTPKELARLESHRRKEELLSECVRRLLFGPPALRYEKVTG